MKKGSNLMFLTFALLGRTVTLCAKSSQSHLNINSVNETQSIFDKVSVTIGYSICSEGDKFDKKLGQTIAEGRANKNPIASFPIFKAMNTKRVIKAILEDHAQFLQKNPEVIKIFPSKQVEQNQPVTENSVESA